MAKSARAPARKSSDPKSKKRKARSAALNAIDAAELRALVTCINAETQRRLLAVSEAIESVQQALH